MINILVIAIFVLGYIAIAFEHPLKVDKAASALITGVFCWTVYTVTAHNPDEALESLTHHLGDISSILFFLLGAMTIVELIDTHNGFAIITDRITTTSKSKLILIVSLLTFFLSALLDNLTTSIVMASLSAKLLTEREDRLWFCGIIVIAANAGGAWSPLGDVTTTMLWIGKQITAMNVIKELILPSIAVCVIPVAVLMIKYRGKRLTPTVKRMISDRDKKEGRIILFSGIGFLLFVPVFKAITHLPPYMGMLLALGFMWIITTIIHKKKEAELAEKFNVARALRKIDSPSILFFLGILMAVSAMQAMGLLKDMAEFLSVHLENEYAIGIVLGLVSAIVDNVPLVAAAQGMYDLNTYPTDHHFWEFLALTTGTGGSAIIIGSAAGVAVMGLVNIDFIWYLKKISWLALIGFVSGVAVFLLQQSL